MGMFGSGPIPLSQIRDYATDVGLESENRETFKYVIQAMDIAYLQDQYEQLELKRKSKDK